MHNPPLSFLDPTQLSVHPVAKLIVDDWANEDPRYIALVEDIRERGIDLPIIVDREHRILDGRRRYRAARQLQLKQVPCIVRADDQVYGVVINSLLQRRHCTKSQLAYLTAPLLDQAFEESSTRRYGNLSKGQETPDSRQRRLSEKTVADWAASIGIERNLLFEARKVWALFAKHPQRRDLTDRYGETETNVTFREFYEKRILSPDDPCGLGAVVAGIASSLVTNGKAKQEHRQLDLFILGIETVHKRLGYWSDLDDAGKRKVRIQIEALADSMPEDLRQEFAAVLRAASKKQAA